MCNKIEKVRKLTSDLNLKAVKMEVNLGKRVKMEEFLDRNIERIQAYFPPKKSYAENQFQKS